VQGPDGFGASRERRSRRAALWASACLFLLHPLLPGALGGQTGPAPERDLSLEDALATALASNPRFLAASNDPSLSEWDVRAAYGQFLPTLSAGSSLSWQGGSGQQLIGGLTQAQLGVGSQPSYYISSYSFRVGHLLSYSTLKEPSRARASRDATEAQVDAAAVSLEAEVTRAYLEVLRQQEQVALARAQLERVRFDLRMALGRAEVGSGTQLDVMQAELQVGRSEVALLQAENAEQTARLRLLQQMGVDVSAAAGVTLTTTFGLEQPTWELEDLYALALERNPLLRAQRSTAEASEVGVKMARSAYYPSLSFSWGVSGFARQASNTDFLIAQARSSVANQVSGCEFQNELYRRLADPLPAQDCTRFSFTDEMRSSIVEGNQAFPFDFTRQPASASLSVSIPIFPGLSRERQLEAARLQRDDAEYLVREQELALRSDLAVGLGAVNTAYQSALLEQRNQTVADEQLRLARERYQLGAITFIDLVDAETVKTQADRQRIAAIYAYHDAITSLEAVVGAPLRDP
jgi:outer membrane protein